MALAVLLKVYNHVWESGCFPPSWRDALIVPIPKPGKDHLDPDKFRRTALTSCLCKTMERTINARLMWSLESQGLLSEKQCGFRNNHSTFHHLVRFETFTRNAFVKTEHVLTNFFDLEKAYDTLYIHFHGVQTYVIIPGPTILQAKPKGGRGWVEERSSSPSF